MISKFKSVLGVAAIVLVSTVGADLVLAQIAKRIIPEWRNSAANAAYRERHPVYHHGLAPMVSSTSTSGEHAAYFATNALGFRDTKPRPVDPARAAKRIVVFGDSFTEGANLNYEDTYVGRISAVLAADGYEVLNAAVASYAPTIYYAKLRYLLKTQALKMSDAVVFIDLSDIWDEATCYQLNPDNTVGNRCNYDDRPMKRFKKWLAEVSLSYHTYRMIKDRLKEKGRRKVGHFEAVTNWERARWTVDKSLWEKIGRPGLAQARARMDDFKALADEYGIAVTVAVYPWPDQIAAGDKDSVQVRYWRDWARQAGARFVDLFPPFFEGDGRAAIERYFTPYDFHYNKAGHALVAGAFLAQWHP